MEFPPEAITLDTKVHLRWQTEDEIEAILWRNAAERLGARAVHLHRHEDGSGFTLTLEATVGLALARFRYTPRALAALAFQGTEPQVRRLQELHWAVWLPRYCVTDIVFN